MDVRIISLNPQQSHPVKKLFPNATSFQAVDFRKKTPQELLDENLITLNAFESLTNGRKYHHEISTSGAVGLHQSFLKVLTLSKEPILICEDDCVPSPRLPTVINEMLLNSSDFDMVIFGPFMYRQSKGSMPSFFKEFDFLTGYFWGTHAVLFSSHGRQKAIQHMIHPVDVQVDALFSRLAMYSNFNILIQTSGEPLAKQSKHISTIQLESDCHLCDIEPNQTIYPIIWIAIILIIIFVYIISVQNKYIYTPSDRFYCPKLRKFIQRKK